MLVRFMNLLENQHSFKKGLNNFTDKQLQNAQHLKFQLRRKRKLQTCTADEEQWYSHKFLKYILYLL